jgi:hypothetical protein
VDLEKISMGSLYLMQYWMDWQGCTGKSGLFHQGFLPVLFVSGNTECVQSYKSNTAEELPELV